MSLAACSSSNRAPKLPPADAAIEDGAADTGACRSDPALASRRDACAFGPGALAADTIGECASSPTPIEHIVVLMQENRSFDQYFGHLRGHGQDDVDVSPETAANPAPDAGGPSPWHHESAYCVQDTDHGWVASHQQWNGGKMDGFATSNTTMLDPTGHRAMGWYDQTDIPFYYDLISTFATSDRYFCSLLGPTYPNRMYLAAGTSFGIVTTNLQKLAPPGVPQIYRSLNDKGVTWKIYTTNLPSILIFPDFANDSAQQVHRATAADFLTDAANGTLPQVSFLDSGFSESAAVETDEHPPADIQLGQHWVWQQVQAVLASPLWSSSAMFITYDEHGGLYDHVSPPAACAPDDTPPAQNPELGGFDRLGFRVPLIVVSPYARRHFVSHETHSHTSILRFIEARFGLPALTKRDANSDTLLDLFDFASSPKLDVPTFNEPPVDQAQIDSCKAAFP
jgi:phospholipase C